jgi:bifunctional non-homologous end joining protein LigD
MNDNRTITLYCQEGSSDKVYQLNMLAVEGGYGLFYANAKRGQALKLSPKGNSPISFEVATKEFDKIVKGKKTSKKSPYVESIDGGQSLELSQRANEDSGIRPKLMNEITKSQALKLCLDPLWGMQPKFDGERRPVIIANGTADGTNRYGEITGGLSTSIKSSLEGFVDMIFDSEDLGTFLAAFDLLEHMGKDLRSMPFIKRYETLSQAIEFNEAIRLSPLATSVKDKQAMLRHAIDEDKEGVVFILLSAPYVSGKASSGGNILKYKLYDEASVIVTGINVQRSVKIAVLDTDGKPVDVGNVTIPSNAAIPLVNSVIEVKYLYAFPNGGKLFQPSLLKSRPDLRICECVQTQLKYKPANLRSSIYMPSQMVANRSNLL